LSSNQPVINFIEWSIASVETHMQLKIIIQNLKLINKKNKNVLLYYNEKKILCITEKEQKHMAKTTLNISEVEWRTGCMVERTNDDLVSCVIKLKNNEQRLGIYIFLLVLSNSNV
jgi:NADH dehydrogenase FAD-containing subunit